MKWLKTPLILIVIAAAAYGGVSLFYTEVEKRLSALTTVQDEVVSKNTGRTLDSAANASSKKRRQKVHDAHKDRTRAANKGSGYAVIISRNIFQSTAQGAQNADEELEDENLEETALQLELLGTISADKDEDTRAIIIDKKTKKQDLYRIGDKVQGSVIKKIQRGKVILIVRGNPEVLLIKKPEMSKNERLVNANPSMRQEPGNKRVRSSKRPPSPRRRINMRQSYKQHQDFEEPILPLDDEDEMDDENEIPMSNTPITDAKRELLSDLPVDDMMEALSQGEMGDELMDDEDDFMDEDGMMDIPHPDQ